MKKIKEHPIASVELFLLLSLIAIVLWTGFSESESYILLQGFLFLFNIAALILCPFIMLMILEKPSKEMKELERKRKLEKTKEYREKYVSEIPVNHSFFGSCVFEKDRNKEAVTLVEGIKETNYGPYMVDVEMEVQEDAISLALAELEKVYRNCDDILNQIYEAAKEQCNDWDEEDADGNPIDLEYIKKYYSLSFISVYDNTNGSISIILDGSVGDENGGELLGYHSFVANINCKTNQISYGLWG
ncbi:MAG: hypothetical protein IJA10_09930 [Lachnospiraceae bacterium]|nr:hypothetical protein [Lachnospiraceae bacterium]